MQRNIITTAILVSVLTMAFTVLLPLATPTSTIKAASYFTIALAVFIVSTTVSKAKNYL